MTLSQPDSGNSSSGAPQFAPALFTRMCSAGSRLVISRTTRGDTLARAEVGRNRRCTRRTFASSASACLQASALREQMYVRTPFSTKPRAIIRPMPRVPPVTRATFPFTEKQLVELHALSCGFQPAHPTRTGM